MKKLILISLCAISLCKAADNSWDQAVQRNYPDGIQQVEYLNLINDQITEIPNLDLPQLRELYLIGNQIIAIPANLNLPQLERLYLSFNQITEIPNLNLHQLRELYLGSNYITYVDPQILQQFPQLQHLYLDKNPLTQENVAALRDAATAAGRHIEIIADDIGEQYLPEGQNIKGADD